MTSKGKEFILTFGKKGTAKLPPSVVLMQTVIFICVRNINILGNHAVSAYKKGQKSCEILLPFACLIERLLHHNLPDVYGIALRVYDMYKIESVATPVREA